MMSSIAAWISLGGRREHRHWCSQDAYNGSERWCSKSVGIGQYPFPIGLWSAVTEIRSRTEALLTTESITSL